MVDEIKGHVTEGHMYLFVKETAASELDHFFHIKIRGVPWAEIAEIFLPCVLGSSLM